MLTPFPWPCHHPCRLPWHHFCTAAVLGQHHSIHQHHMSTLTLTLFQAPLFYCCQQCYGLSVAPAVFPILITVSTLGRWHSLATTNVMAFLWTPSFSCCHQCHSVPMAPTVFFVVLLWHHHSFLSSTSHVNISMLTLFLWPPSGPAVGPTFSLCHWLTPLQCRHSIPQHYDYITVSFLK